MVCELTQKLKVTSEVVLKEVEEQLKTILP